MRTRAPAVASLLVIASLGLSSCADLGGLDLESVGDEGKTTYIKLALNQAETHPSYIALENLSSRFEEATDGRWKIEVFPNEQLGSQQEVLQFVPNKDTRRTGTPDTCEPDNSACYDSEGKEIL